MFSDHGSNLKNIIMIFADKEKRQEPLYAIWKQRKQRWYITKREHGNNIRNVEAVLSATEFVKALESERYFLP
jgi:uncharacterized protein with ParB-like and HNH nuclease domain